MEALPNLRQQRGQILRKITILLNTLAQADKDSRLVTKEEIDVYQEQVAENKKKYEDIQSKIVATDGNPTISDDFSHEENFEAKLFEVKTNLLTRLNAINSVQFTSSPHNMSATNNTLLDSNGQFTRIVEQQNRILEHFNDSVLQMTSTSQHDRDHKLPALHIPFFTGKYEDWISFHDLYVSLVHQNERLSKVKKFQYLMSLVREDAAGILKHTTVTEANYDEAWEKLNQRYSKKIPIVSKHIQRFLDQPIIKETSDAIAIRRLCDTSDEVVRALKSLKVDGRDAWLVHIVLQKLDSDTKRLWAHENGDNDYDWKVFLTFLEKHCITLESCQQPFIRKNTSSVPSTSASRGNNQRQAINKTLVTQSEKCKIGCNEFHAIYFCPKFLSCSIDERILHVKKLNLCYNCLRASHNANICRSRNCKHCGKRHSSLLCFSQTPSPPNSTTQLDETKTQNAEESKTITATSTFMVASRDYVFLSTAIVLVYDSQGTPHAHRALLDSGSQSNFATKALITKLGIPTENVTFSIEGIGQSAKCINKKSNLLVRSRALDFNNNIEFLVIDRITSEVPQIKIDIDHLTIPKHCVLADPYFNVPDSIDLLIGVEFFYQILKPERLDLGVGMPILQNSSFGWLVSGRCRSNETRNITHSFLTVSNEDLDNRLSKFWEEDFNIETKKSLSSEETSCEQHFLENTTRNSDGRFIVALPFNNKYTKLGSSKEQALKRLSYLERKLTHDSNLQFEYNKFIQEYISLGHMTLIGNLDDNDIKDAFYLPHHGVWKLSSTTTKLRVVFDGSSKTTTGVSINDALMVGRPSQDLLFSIILRFRTHNIVLMADIEKMFRQVLVRKEDRAYQRILWRFNSSEPVDVYEMNTITYGLSCSPHLSTRCLVKLAEDSDSFPLAKCVLLNDVYIDDVLTGCTTIEQAKLLQRELKDLLAQGGFNLRKWVSNSHEVLNEIPPEDRELSDVDFNLDEEIKTLGLRWCPSRDTFQFTTSQTSRNPSKRIVLSEISKLFDPLGLLGPTIINAKLLMQKLWKAKCSWDEPLPEDLSNQWTSYQQMLSYSSNCVIHRHVKDFPTFSRLELHGFSDASEQAYGACVYVRAFNHNGLVSSHLLCSKSRVAPIKRPSLPRLELCGAHLLALLIKNVKGCLNLAIDDIICWSDSTIVLAWISGDTSRWKTFVSNRVNELVSTCSPSTWHHISTDQNPSDLLTRPNDSTLLAKNSLWWHGPTFLLDSTFDYSASANNCSHVDNELVNQELRSTKQVLVHVAVDHSSILDFLINNFSDYSRIIYVLAYIRRYIDRRVFKKPYSSLYLSPAELESSRNVLIKYVQAKHFAPEIELLKTNRSVSKRFKSLSLYCDDHGVLRVGGRVPGRHPILLPSNDRFTLLLFDAEHKRLLHAGPQSLLASIRLKFWPLNGRNLARKITRKCIDCFHVKLPKAYQLMADLPEDRIRQNRAFKICGIDYGGPFTILQSKGRGAKSTKAYVALFVCLTTKAVHLELVSELTTSAFLAALRRFISRRGRCSRIYSDNATNFVGAKGELKDLFNLLLTTKTKEEIQKFVRNEGMEWRFIAAGSPHQGGLWEAGIKSTKHHLRRVLKTHTFTFEEFNTLLVQIEACLNSRPLTPQSSDPNDLQPLTPAHFLIGESLVAIPEPDYINTNLNRLSRWQLVQQCIQHFWKRWSQEYLSTLYLRSKWQSPQENLQVGDMVLIRDENRPPLLWNMGRISEIFFGSDQLVRTVRVKTATGFINRAVHKLCKLPLEVYPDQN